MGKHLTFILTLLFLIPNLCWGQEECVVKGMVTDLYSNEPISEVSVSCKIDGISYECKTDANGCYKLKLKRGKNTTLRFSHISYSPMSKVVNCSGRYKTVNANMEITSIMLKEVEVKRNVPLIKQRGDTTVYYADAYKVNSDATAYDLISQKLPGVGQQDGKLKAFGDEVKEIYIDGREYFKNDINLALKNLPANVIDEIQIYDQISDYSMLTGFDDGNTKKTINIKTKNGTAKSQFGKGYLGYGTNDRYKLYGMYNLFNNDIRWSVFAQWNNVNEQNFSMLDLLSASGTASSSAPSQSPYSKSQSNGSFHPTASDDISSMLVDVSDYGITTSRAIGTNFSDNWANNKMKFSGHYLFNSSSNNTNYDIFDAYFGETNSDNLQNQKVYNDNTNHRFNAKYEYQITPTDYVMLRPALSYQKKDETSDLVDWTVTESDTSLLLNQLTITDQYAFNTSGEAMYIHKFGDSGHALSADARISYMHTHEDINMDFANAQTDDSALQNTMCKNTQETYSYMLSYIFPLNEYNKFKIDAGWRENYGIMRRNTEIMRSGFNEYSVDSLLSGSTWNNYGGLHTNVSYMLNHNNFNLITGTEFQIYNLYTSNDRYYFKRNYQTWLPYVLLRWGISSSQLHFQYKTSHEYPGLLQLHDAINNANAIMAIRGNIKLQPAYHHNAMVRLVSPIHQNGSVFVFFANMEQADKYIATMRSLASESFEDSGERRNTEICSYTNADGYFSWSSLLAYGFPVNPIKSNINLSTLVKCSKIPGYWDNNKIFTRQWNWSGFLTIGSNISENVDFVIDVNGKYTNSTNVSYSDMDISYWSLSYGGQLNWQFTPSFKIVLECGRTNYFGSGTSQYNAWISNASLAYKFLKNKNGELRLSVHDIFDQDNSFYQTTTELYRREVTTNILGQYAMLTFTYNLNTKK